MAVNRAELLNLPPAEQLEIIELLWDNLGSSTSPIPLPDWVGIEGMRRLSEMNNDPSLGVDHATVWESIKLSND